MSDPVVTDQSYSLDELEHHVVAAALADTDILEYVSARYLTRLSGKLHSLFNAAKAYFNVTRGLLTRAALITLLQQNEPDPTKHQDYIALYDSLTSAPYSEVSESDRRWFLHRFDLEWQKQQTGQILAQAAEAMREGHEAHGTTLTGAEAAWQVLAEGRLEFDNRTAGGVLHDAEVTGTIDVAKQDYEDAVNKPTQGIPLALPEVTEKMDGLRAGDLHLVAAFASEGKSFMLLNDAHNAWKHGHNVAFATGEMSFRKCRNRFIALHSNEPQFSRALETTKIDRGTLDADEHKLFLEVCEDIKNNVDYGKFYIFPFPYRATPTLIFNKFSAYDQIVPLDLAVIDYLGLLASERMRVSRREELDDLIREAKALALDFGNGRGVALEAAYQTNRVSFETARREGYYTLACFSESSEAEKSCDSALWLLSIPQNPDELKAGFIKNRDDELGEPFFMRRNLKHAQLASLKRSAGQRPDSGVALLDI